MSYRLFTLGAIRVLGEDGSEIRLRSAKHTALFVYLNANGWRTFLRSELCDLLWTTERSRARHSLSQALYDIRSRIGPVVDTDGGEGVRLVAPGAWFDGDEIEARMAREEPGAASELYRGPFGVELDEVGTERFEYWLESERRRLRTVGRNAFRRHIESLEEQGRWNRLAEVARRFLKRVPEDSDAQRTFVRSLWLGGDRASALEHFASLEESRPGVADRLRPLVDRIEGGTTDRVRETTEPEDAPLVGRRDELRRLRRMSRSLEQPVVAHLQGEAGIGKTRLVEELRSVLELDGFRIVESRCWEAESNVPYSVVAEALEPWLGPTGASAADTPAAGELELARAALFPRTEEPGDLTADPEALKELRRRVFEEVTVFVRGLVGATPALWIVEDIQWIDDTSAALLHYLLRRLDDVPLLMAFTSRPTFDRDDGLSRYLDRPGRVETLALGPLDDASVDELLSKSSGETPSPEALARIAELSGGNPYFALELLRVLREQGDIAADEEPDIAGRDLVDGRLKGILRDRLRGISVEGLKVLEAVAALGGRAPWDSVLSVASVEVDSPSWICGQLGRHGLLRTEGGEVEFAHDILREMVYADLGDIRRYSLHRMSGETLAREGDASPGVLADHFHLGGDSERAYHYAVAAARDAESRGAHQEAARYADVALASVGEEGTGEEVSLRRLAARAHSSNGELGDAARRLEPLIDGRSKRRSEEEIRSLLELAEIRIEEAEAEAARRALDEAEDGIESSLTGPLSEALSAVCLSLELRCAILYGERRAIEEVGARLGEAFRDGRTLDGNDWGRAGLVLAAYQAFYRSAAEAKELIGQVMEGQIPMRSRMRAVALLGTLELRTCRWDRADYLFRRGRRLARDRNDVALEASFLNNLGCLRMEWGRWAEAEETLEAALALYRSASKPVQSAVHPLLNLGSAALYQLRSSEARARFADAVETTSALAIRKFEAEARSCLGLLDLQQGKLRAAERQHREVQKLSDGRSLSQEGFKVDWFSAFCGEAGSAAAVLRERAEAYRGSDLLSRLKLRWLAEISADGREPGERVRRKLRSQGLLWFEKFAERWIKAARGNRARA